MSTRYPKEAVTPRVGDQRAGEPEQSPTPRSFAGLVKREEVIAKPGTEVLTVCECAARHQACNLVPRTHSRWCPEYRG
jgi:hypothetical protein